MSTLYVYPDGRRIFKADPDATISEMDGIRRALEEWKPGVALVVSGRDVDVVNVTTSLEDRVAAIEERLGMSVQK